MGSASGTFHCVGARQKVNVENSIVLNLSLVGPNGGFFQWILILW